MRKIKRNGSLMARARVGAGYSQQDVAKALGVSVEHLSRVEHGHSGMSETLVRGLAEMYRVSLTKIRRWSARAQRLQLRKSYKRLKGGRSGRAA